MEIIVRQDMVDVTSMPRYITVHKVTGDEIPVVYRGRHYCSDCGDMHDEYTFDLRFNPNNFEEKWVGGGIYKEYLAGLTSWHLEGELYDCPFDPGDLISVDYQGEVAGLAIFVMRQVVAQVGEQILYAVSLQGTGELIPIKGGKLNDHRKL